MTSFKSTHCLISIPTPEYTFKAKKMWSFHTFRFNKFGPTLVLPIALTKGTADTSIEKINQCKIWTSTINMNIMINININIKISNSAFFKHFSKSRIIQHIFVPACSLGRKTWFSRKPWFPNSKFGFPGHFDRFWVFQN